MNTDKKMFNLHIGMPKTGTKTLQVHMFPKHPEIDFLGTYIHSRRTRDKQCRDSEVLEFINELIWKNFTNPNIPRCKELYAKWVASAAGENKILMWSWESLMENRHEVQRIRAENIRNIVGDANITVCLRSPVSLIESLYIQLLKRDNIGGYAKVGKKHRFETIEQWLKNGWNKDGHPPKVHLEYAESLQIFTDVFGKNSVKVLLFEQLVEDQSSYIRNLCDFLGIDPEGGVQLASGPKINERWGQEQYNQLKVLNHSPLRALKFRFSNKQKRKVMLGMTQGMDESSKKKTSVVIPPEWIERIEEKTRKGNRWIQTQWDVSLEQYGYPV